MPARPLGLIYALDQDRRTTSSLGIYNYTARLIAALARRPDPGFDLEIHCTRANAADLIPSDAPAWLRAVVWRGRYSTGARRLWADHVLAWVLPLVRRAAFVHYVKGWMPLPPLPRVRTVATLYDTIMDFYRAQALGYDSTLKLAYFEAQLRHTLRATDAILTISETSRTGLCAIEPRARSRMTVAPLAPMLREPPPATDGPRAGILVIGSKRPHKATPETLRLLAGYAARATFTEPILVAGLDGWLPAWGAPPAGADIRYLGRVDDDALARAMATARAVVFLSYVEGFGLPCVEAWALDTPVVWRDASAMAEIMRGYPGGWLPANPEYHPDWRPDAEDAARFARALDNVLALTDADRARLGRAIRTTYTWDRVADAALAAYRGAPRRPA